MVFDSTCSTRFRVLTCVYIDKKILQVEDSKSAIIIINILC